LSNISFLSYGIVRPLTHNGFQAGAGGFLKIHLSTRTKLTYEDTCFLAEAKTKNGLTEGKAIIYAQALVVPPLALAWCYGSFECPVLYYEFKIHVYTLLIIE
jgi:hypothetical protein